MKGDKVPEAEPYLDPEVDKMETLIIDERQDGSGHSYRSYSYSRTSSQAERPGDWPSRIRGGLLVRLAMAILMLVCIVATFITSVLACINYAVVIVTLFKDLSIRKRAWGSLKLAVCWALMSFGSAVAVIIPSIGVGLMLAFLVILDEASPFREMLRQRLQGIHRP